MALTPGTYLGPYEIVGLLGAGGMGEVYRARDTKLDREVAIKVLPELLVADPERVARFQREAKTLAALNHPHIGGIYGVEDADAVRALVLELVDGPTLADRIAQGPIPLDEALPIARQIAEALEAAHEQGIIHRDLKPANIKLRPDGTVKVLDFGLAKAMEPAGAASGSATMSPTITTPAMMTGIGMILGTAAYMSPEQAKGRPADKRSDLWAFGCVLYEMLTGKRAFAGEDVSDTLAAVLRAEPDWTTLPAETPHSTRFLLLRCLERDRRNRVADASTIRFVLDTQSLSAAAAGVGAVGDAARKSWWRRSVPPVAAAVAAAAATGMVMWWALGSSAPAARGVTRFPVALQEAQSFGSNGVRLVAVSPDGSHIAYAALSPGEPGRATQRLYIRPMFETVAKPISGSEALGNIVGAPVFSPDNQSIVYYAGTSTVGTGLYTRAQGVLKRISVNGGSALTLCNVALPMGMSWSGDDIVLGQLSRGIVRVRANGGEPEQIVSIKEGEIAQGPQLLPDGDAVLFTHVRGVSTDPTDETWDKADIVVQSLNSGARKTLIQGGSDARYLPSGHLVYAVSGTLRAVPFDARRLEIIGKPTPILEGVGRSRFGPTTRTGSAHVSVSDTGSLVYIPGPVSPTSSLQNLAYIDRGGAIESLKLTPGRYEFPRISPDGQNVAVGIADGSAANVWVYDLSRTTAIRQLTTGGKNRFPVWSADGQYIAFQSDRDGDLAIFWQRADGSAPAARLTKPDSGTAHVPDAWSPKSDYLLFDVESASGISLAMLSLRDRKVAAFPGVQSATIPPAAVFSPDARWVAYQSNEVPNPRIFIQPLPATGTAFPVANGRHPHFSADGKQLYYTVADRTLAVALSMPPSFSVGNPVVVSQNTAVGTPRGILTESRSAPPVSAQALRHRRSWDLKDDNRFVAVIDETPAATAFARHIEVVLNWLDELKQRVPTR